MNLRKLAAAVSVTVTMLLGTGYAAAQSLPDVIASAQAQLGGEVYDASRVGSLAEVELLSNGRLVDAIIEFETGRLITSEVFGSTRRTAQVSTALGRAVLTVPQAIEAALQAAGPGDVLEAALVASGRQSGRQFIVDIRTPSGVVDVIVDAANGSIIRIIRD